MRQMAGMSGAVEGFALDVHLPGPAEEVEVVDVDAAEGGLERGEDVADGKADGLGLVAVDVEEDGRRGGGEGAEDAVQLGVLVGCGEEAVEDAAHFGGFAALEVLELVFEAAAGGEADDGRQVEGEG